MADTPKVDPVQKLADAIWALLAEESRRQKYVEAPPEQWGK